MIENFVRLNYKIHLAIGLVIRLVLVAYGIYHDQISTVAYTDVDYKVFTDAARLVTEGKSPFERHTFRYTPLLAYLLVPNVILHHAFGKVIFSLFDLIDGMLIRIIVKNCLLQYSIYSVGRGEQKIDVPSVKSRRKKSKSAPKFENSGCKDERLPNIAMLVWLYNPMTLAIATRGSCDAVAAFLVLISLFFLECKKKAFIAGLLHGLSIHFRLYPVMYSLTFYMYLSSYSKYSIEDRRKKVRSPSGGTTKQLLGPPGKAIAPKTVEPLPQRQTILKKEYLFYLIPNIDQIFLVSGCLLSMTALFHCFRTLYGDKFVYETYIYHLVRKDTRHNFSLFFYLQYLTAYIKNIGLWQRALIVLPQLVLIIVFSVRYGLNQFCLNFSILAQTIVMVTYNTVLTSQYFVWVLAVLPLCLWQIKVTLKGAAFLLTIWFAAQAAWLLPAYLLEFQGQNTFLFIWIQSVSFFCANVAILGRLIMNFAPPRDKTNGS